MQEKVTQNYILQRRRLGCQTQRFRRLVDLLGFQPNLPAVSLLCISLYTEITGLSFDKGRLKPLFQTALTFYASRGFLRLR